jgi:hypothetical protein
VKLYFGQDPQARDVDSNGVGDYDLWQLRFPCDLEVALLAFHLGEGFAEVPPDRETCIEVQANNTDFPHILAHLPLDVGEVSLWLPDRRTFPAARWIVMRQDDNGNVFEVQACSSRCEANLSVVSFEAGRHKQIYWVEERAERAG